MTAVDDSRTDGQVPAIGGVGRARASLAALETLERLRESGEPATDADRAALLGWAGWGSLANAFEPGRKGVWAEIGERIEWLLPPADQIEARKATYSAFYTPPEITRACWQILQGLGFEGGRILEPGCGAGVFMEHTPAEIRDDVRWVGVERDPTTAAIAAVLHPDARILTAPIQKAPLPVASVDAVLGNVPFADHLVYDPGAPEPVRASLHNYCLWRSIQTVRPGGIAVLITSRYTLDAKDPSARQHLFAQADLLDAIRLPSTVWQPGGTKVTADILVLRRRRSDEDIRTHDRTWLDAQDVPQLENPVNRMLLTRPELVVGQMRVQHGHRYGHTLSVEFTPTETVPTWQQGMAQAVAAVTAERPDQRSRLWHVDAPIQVINAAGTALSDAEGRPEGSFHIVEGRAMVVVDGHLAAVQTRRTRKTDTPTSVQTDTADANTDGTGMGELNFEHTDDGDLADADTGSASAEDRTADKYEYFDLSGKQLGELSALIALRDTAVAVQEHELRALEQERIAQRAEQRLAMAHRQLINAHAVHLTALTALTSTLDGQLATPAPLVRAAVLAAAHRAAATARQVPDGQQQVDAERAAAQQQVTRVDGELEPMRERLNTLYDAYQARYGFLNRVKISTGKPDAETGLPTITKRRPPIMQDALHAVGEGTEPVTVRFRSDPNYFDLLALEDWDADNQVGRKHKIFTTRVNKAAQRITRADSAADAVALSLDAHNKLDLPTIAALLDVTVEQVPEALGELAYFDPATREWTERGEYLSGDVRIKLDQALAAAEQDPQRFTRNVEALQARQPRDLGPGEIYGQLGAAWIPETDVAQFIRELLHPRGQVAVQREPLTSTWSLTLANKADRSRPEASHEWGTEAKDAYSLIELELNGSVAEVTKTIKEKGKKETIVDRDATTQAKAKQKQIATRFSEWLWEDPERADRLAEKYNRSFNATVLRDYDGSHLTVPGMAADFVPYASQRDMVFRAISNKTALCGHAVGGGKTTIMAMTAVKLRQLGLANKPMIVVLKATLEDIAREIKQRVPAANLLVADENSMSDWRSRALWAKRCATGDYDAVIITHPAFTKISMHEQFQADYLAELAASYRASLNAAMGSVDAEDNETGPSDRRVKQVEKLVSALEARAEYLLEHASDDGIYFEQLGVDYLLVDEFHYFKNLQVPCHTEGFSMSASKRATDLDMKLSWLRTQRDRVATFFSGTPVSNSMLELYVVLHYMMPERLEELGMSSPDAWARWCVLFEEVLEISPDGQTPRTKRRPNRFKNVYELLMLLTERADIRSKKQLGLLLPPTTRATEVVPRSRVQEAYIAELAARAEAVKGKPPRKGEDNILKVATDGRKGAIDPALVELFDPAAVKFDQAIDNIVATYRATRDLQFPADAKHEADAVTGQRGGFQLAFCDLGTPGDKNKKTTGTTGRNPVPVYAKIRDGLVAEGIPRERIRFIHDAKSDQQRAQLFAACRTGEVSVLIASTEKGGVGVNVQDRMVRLHHIDAPWRPSDIEQREGRGERPGNRMRALADLIAQMEERGEAVPENWPRTVEITTYVSEGTFDSFMWGKLEYKAGFIGQLLGSKLDPGLREIEDIGTVTMNYAEVKALAAGNEQLMDLAKAEQQLKALQDLAAAHTRTQRRLDTEITRYQKTAGMNDATIRALDAITAAVQACEDDQRGFFTSSGDPAAGPIPEDDLDTVLVGVAQQAVTARNDAKARRSAAEVQRGVEPVGKSTDVLRWQSMGLTFELRATGWRKDTLYALVRPNGLRSTVDQHRLELNLTYLNKGQHFRIRQALDKFLTLCADQASDLRANTAELRDRMEAGRRQVGKPLPQLAELEAARTEVDRLKTGLESVKAQVDSESGGHNQGAGANQQILQLARDAYFDPARRRQLVEVLTATSEPGTVVEAPPRPRLAPVPSEPSASPAHGTHLPPAASLPRVTAGTSAPSSPNRSQLVPSNSGDAGVSSVDLPQDSTASRREPGATVVLPDTTALSETRAPDHASRTWAGTHASGVDILITRHTIDLTATPAAVPDPAGSSAETVWTYRLSRRTPDRAFVIGEPWTPSGQWATATELLDHLQRHVTAYTLPRALLPFLIAAASQDVEDLRAIPDRADLDTPLLASAAGGQNLATSVEEAAAYLVQAAQNTDDYRRPLVWRGVEVWFEVLPTNPAYPTDLTGLVAVVGTAYRNPIPTDWLTLGDNRIVGLLDDILTHADRLRDAHETYLAALTALAADPAQPIDTLPDRPTPASVLKPTTQPAQQPPTPRPAGTPPPAKPVPAPGDTAEHVPPAPAAELTEPENVPSMPRPRGDTPTEPIGDGDVPNEPTDHAKEPDRAAEVGLGGVDHDERSVRTDQANQADTDSHPVGEPQPDHPTPSDGVPDAPVPGESRAEITGSERVLTLHFSQEHGVLLLGTDETDGLGPLLKQQRAGWKHSHRITGPHGETGAWYLPKTRQQNRQGTKLDDFHRRIDDRITRAGRALVQRGFTLRLDLHDLPDQTVRALQDWRRSAQPTAEEIRQRAAVTARVASAMDRTRARIGHLADQVPEPVLRQAWTHFAGEFLSHGTRPEDLAARRQVLLATLPESASPADEHVPRVVRAVLVDERAASAVPDTLRDQFRAAGATEEDVADVVGGIAGYTTALLDRISDTDEIGRYLAATDAVAVVDALVAIAHTVVDVHHIERPENFPPRSVIAAITQPVHAPMTSREITAITGLPYWLVRDATPENGAADALERQNRILWGHTAAEDAVLRQLQIGLISVDQAGDVLRRARGRDPSVFGCDQVRLPVRVGQTVGEITEFQVDLSGHVVLRGTTSDGEPLVVRADPRTRWDPNTTVLTPPPDRPVHLIHRGTDRLVTDRDAATTTATTTATNTVTNPIAGPVTESVDAATESAPAVGEGVTSDHPVVGYVRESVARLPHDPNPERAVVDRYQVAAAAIDLYVVNPEGSGVGWLLRTIGRHDGPAESVIPRSLELRPAVEWPHWIRSLRQSSTILRAAGGLKELADRATGVADLLARRMDALATTPAAFQAQTGAAGVRLLPAAHPAAPALARQLDRALHSQRVTGERHDTQGPLKLAIEVLGEPNLSADEIAERACYGTPHSLLRWWPTVTELRDLAEVAETAGYTTPLPGREVSAPELWRAVADGVAARLTDRPHYEPDVPVEVPAVVPTQPRALYAGEKTTPVDRLLDKISNGTAHREDAEHTRMAASTATDVAQPMLADLDAADPDRVQRATAALQQGAHGEALLHLSWAVDGRHPVGRSGVREAWDVLYQLLWPEPGWDLERVARRMITWADHDPAQLAGGLVALATAWRTRAETGDTLARLLSEPPVAAIADQLESVAGYLATHWQFTQPTLPRIRVEQASLFDLDHAAEAKTEKKPRTRKRPAANIGNTQSTRPDPDDASIAPATSQDHTPPVSDTPRTGSDAAPPMLAGEPAPQAPQRTRDAAPTIPDTTTAAAADTTPDVVGETASGAPTLRGLRAIAAAHDLHVRVVRVADAAFIVVHEPAAPTPPVLSWPVGATEVFDGAGYPMPAEHAGEYLARYRSMIEPELVAAATGVEDWARRVAYLTPHLLPPLGQQTNQQTWQQVEIRRRLDEALTLAGEDRAQAENRLRGAESLAGSVSLTPEREAQIVREIHDHASGYAWAGDVGRYLTAPGHLDGSWREWEWINTYVRDHPAVLDGHPDHNGIQARVKAELAVQQQAGDDLLRGAAAAHRAGAFEQALDLLDQADLANPTDAARWARPRARVHQKQAQTPTPPPALDQSTPPPDTDPAVHAKQTAAPDLPDSTADRQIRTEPKQHEPGQPSPDGTDSSPAQPNIGVASAPEVEVWRERGVEVFEAAVAEASQALVETAAAGGHEPLACSAAFRMIMCW